MNDFTDVLMFAAIVVFFLRCCGCCHSNSNNKDNADEHRLESVSVVDVRHYSGIFKKLRRLTCFIVHFT